MGLARVAVALVTVAIATPAGAAPVSFELGFGGGIGYGRRTGTYRDDDTVDLRLAIGLTRRLAFDVGGSQDVDRIENAVHAGLRFLRCGCWSPYWSPYLHGSLALVNASHLASNVDVAAGIGQWGRLAPSRVSWLGWFVETDVVVRVGDTTAIGGRIEAGVAIAPSFWR